MNRSFSFLVLLSTFFSSCPPAFSEVTALWHWSFDNAADPGLADVGSHNATVENGSPVVNTSDKVFGSGALDLDGASNLLDGADSLPLGSRGYSVASWIKPRCEECDLAGILSKHDVGGDRVFGLEQGDSDGSIRFSSYFDNEAPTFIQTRSDTTDQPIWYHVVGVWNPQTNTQSLYVDGMLIDSRTMEISHSVGDSSLRIGLSDAVANGGVFFNGLIDEAWIFDGALNPVEVNSLMNGNMVPVPSSVSLALWASVVGIGAVARRRRRNG